MKFPQPVTVKWIADLIDAEVIGEEKDLIAGINEIHKVEEGDLVFVDHPKYYNTCIDSAASFIIINNKSVDSKGKTLLVCEEPFEAYLKIVTYFRPFNSQSQHVHSGAVIGENTTIFPGAFVGENVIIGNNCIIHPNVVIYNNTVIGNNVVIHAGASIGADAFYYNNKKNRPTWYKKMLSCGRVVLEDNVEIGANTCIDKGVTHDTLIKQGTKIDNLVQIGHDVVIGENAIIAAQVGIAGCTTIGNGALIWGQVGINKTISIGENAVILAQTGVSNSLEGNKVYFGYPAQEATAKRKELIWIKRIPEIWDRIKKLESNG